MRNPSAAIQRMPRSGIREVFDRARRMPDAIHLEMGEPDFATPSHIVAAGEAALAAGYTKYTPNAGFADLREALAGKLSRVNGLAVRPDQVSITAGGISALYSTMVAVCDRGDQLLVLGPSWPNYRMIATLLGLDLVQVPLADDGSVDLDVVERYRTPVTAAVIVNSPSNPTGTVISSEAMGALVAWTEQHDLWLVSDEVYDEMTFDGPAPSPFPLATSGNVVSIYSFSKTYAMTGWRVGYAVAAPEVAPLVEKTLEPTISCANAPAQRAALAAVTGSQDCVHEMRSSYRSRRDGAVAQLVAAGVPFSMPSGAFYLWVDVAQAARGSTQFALDLLDRQGVAVTPGIAFGDLYDDHVRISLATARPLLEQGVARLIDELTS